ncbi:MAG TPA: fused MFS/spermidine synthase [Candidatus Angelobacter sp.]|nr:fused MFS/spermidine synthase [Candidatus Angelobacter sp.]
MTALFSATMFVSAALMFSVQPMIAKTVLPLLGGSPSVWNTCMVFFQVVLLAGYVCAHWSATRLGSRAQIYLQLALLAVSFSALPFVVSEATARSPVPRGDPALWLLGCLASTVGLPFFAISTTAPLLQRWFASASRASGRDPYFLYSASNAGSLAALLSYPTLLEPRLRLGQQVRAWTIGYAALAVLVALCGIALWRGRRVESECVESPSETPRPDAPGGSVALARRLFWMALAFVPSSLMLGTTQYLTTDVASIPLFWVVPLAIYLLTFVLAFARRGLFPARWTGLLLAVATLAVMFQMLTHGTHPVWLVIGMHLFVLFFAAMVCHGRLADDRPAPLHLTEFYLCLSLGGALGGLFDALVAPNIFNNVAEYPLVLVFACLLRPRREATASTPAQLGFDVALPLLLAVLAIGAALTVPALEIKFAAWRNALAIGVPVVIAFTFVDRPLRFALGMAAVLTGGWFYSGAYGRVIHAERNFFGVSRVTVGSTGAFHYLVHGNTLHGAQHTDAGRRCEPLTYYHRTGPLADVFREFDARPASPNVAAVGLGAGSVICYSEPGQHWTFYEIDPAVIRVAQDTNLFAYLGRCARADFNIVSGDARLRLAEAPPGHYGLIVLDAFSSDAIPVHLLTREALGVYLKKLAPGGLLAFHISNRSLDLEPVVGALARDAGLICVGWDDWNVSTAERLDGKEESQWVVMVRRREDLGRLGRAARWLPVQGGVVSRVWTDDFSNLLGVFKWR